MDRKRLATAATIILAVCVALLARARSGSDRSESLAEGLRDAISSTMGGSVELGEITNSGGDVHIASLHTFPPRGNLIADARIEDLTLHRGLLSRLRGKPDPDALSARRCHLKLQAPSPDDDPEKNKGMATPFVGWGEVEIDEVEIVWDRDDGGITLLAATIAPSSKGKRITARSASINIPAMPPLSVDLPQFALDTTGLHIPPSSLLDASGKEVGHVSGTVTPEGYFELSGHLSRIPLRDLIGNSILEGEVGVRWDYQTAPPGTGNTAAPLQGSFETEGATLARHPLLQTVGARLESKELFTEPRLQITGDIGWHPGRHLTLSNIAGDSPDAFRIRGDLQVTGEDRQLEGSLRLGVQDAGGKLSWPTPADSTGTTWLTMRIGGRVTHPQENLSNRLLTPRTKHPTGTTPTSGGRPGISSSELLRWHLGG